MITYLDLATYLPDAAFDSPDPDQLLFNFAVLNPSNPSDSMAEALAKFLDAIAKLTAEINANRAKQTPPLKPIDFCTKAYIGTPEDPKLQYSLTFPVDINSFVENVVDPTA